MKRMISIGCSAICFCAFMACATWNSPAIIRDAGQLPRHEGQRIVIEGRVAREIWQHMMTPTDAYPHETYFDIGTGQIVLYSRKPITCGGMVRATGTVIKLEGSSKNPHRKETITEYHVTADAWECLN